jgi:hypothetical protein
MPSSAARFPASTTSVDADDVPAKVQDNTSGDLTPDQEADGGNSDGDKASLP